MQLIRSLDDLPERLRGGAVSIGNFDGVHQGHARIVERLRANAGELGGASIVFTFDPHPVRLLRPERAPPPLTWTERKAELLGELGVDAMIAYPTDERLLSLTASEFFNTIIRSQLQATALVEGPNFCFGRGRQGTVGVLAELCRSAGVRLEIVSPQTLDDDCEQLVSSSRIRALIQAGAVEQAARWLTRPYLIRGLVTHGAGRGAKIGFPTANVSAVDTLLPGLGVYGGLARTTEETVAAAINVGPNPTFGEQAHKIEAHLIDRKVALYGQPLEVDFLFRIRDIVPFASVEQLVAQLAKDIDCVRQTIPRGR